jgi:general stress protein 26
MIHDDLTLYFATDAASQKAGNIKLNNKVSVAMASETQNFYRLRGLSMSGMPVDAVRAHIERAVLEPFDRHVG